MHDHLHKRDGGYADVFEVVWICAPRSCIVDFLRLLGVELIEGITGRVDELDGVLDLWRTESVRHDCHIAMLDIPQPFCASIVAVLQLISKTVCKHVRYELWYCMSWQFIRSCKRVVLEFVKRVV